MNDLSVLSAVEISDLIKSRQISVQAVTLFFLERIKQINPKINAVIAIRSSEDILLEAAEKDSLIEQGIILGPLHGIPMTVKDSFSVKGIRNTNGHPAYRNHIATEDAELVTRLKNAGAIIIGKTSLPLFSIDWQTYNWWDGRTNNPFDLRRTCGGSSGGSAAAVAAGLTPLELGSDAGGSLRVPAHFCGVCTLKATEHALSNRGQYKFPGKPQGQRHLTVAGPIAKNVCDLLLMMPLLWNGTGASVNPIPLTFESSCYNGDRLQIAYAETIDHVEVDREYHDLFIKFVNRLRAAGHHLHQDGPVYNEQLGYQAHGKLLGFEFDAGSPVPSVFTKLFFYFFILLKYRDRLWAKGVAGGIGMSAVKYLRTLEIKDEVSDRFTDFFKKYDIWITPVASFGAFKHYSTGKPFTINGKRTAYTDALGKFNFTTALSGHPIVVIPIGKTSDGMPVGVQIHAQRWTDKRLLEIALSMEGTAPIQSDH